MNDSIKIVKETNVYISTLAEVHAAEQLDRDRGIHLANNDVFTRQRMVKRLYKMRQVSCEAAMEWQVIVKAIDRSFSDIEACNWQDFVQNGNAEIQVPMIGNERDVGENKSKDPIGKVDDVCQVQA